VPRAKKKRAPRKKPARKRRTDADGYLDPKDQFVRSPGVVTLRALADKWHRKQGDGLSYSSLRKRSAREKWVAARSEHRERIRNNLAAAEQEVAKSETQQIRDRYSSLLEGVMASATRFLRQYDPTDEAVAEWREAGSPGPAGPAGDWGLWSRAHGIAPYKDAKQAADVLIHAIRADREVRGLDVLRVEDVTARENPLEGLSDDELVALWVAAEERGARAEGSDGRGDGAGGRPN